jgi:hypothetical protein
VVIKVSRYMKLPLGEIVTLYNCALVLKRIWFPPKILTQALKLKNNRALFVEEGYQSLSILTDRFNEEIVDLGEIPHPLIQDRKFNAIANPGFRFRLRKHLFSKEYLRVMEISSDQSVWWQKR